MAASMSVMWMPGMEKEKYAKGGRSVPWENLQRRAVHYRRVGRQPFYEKGMARKDPSICRRSFLLFNT
jgi:hypothetical protein